MYGTNKLILNFNRAVVFESVIASKSEFIFLLTVTKVKGSNPATAVFISVVKIAS